jgi:outer membrane protein
VLDRSGPTLFGIPGVLYADAGYDMTDAVLTEVNKDRPAPAAAPAATPAATTPAPAAPATNSGFTVPNVTK